VPLDADPAHLHLLVHRVQQSHVLVGRYSIVLLR